MKKNVTVVVPDRDPIRGTVKDQEIIGKIDKSLILLTVDHLVIITKNMNEVTVKKEANLSIYINYLVKAIQTIRKEKMRNFNRRSDLASETMISTSIRNYNKLILTCLKGNRRNWPFRPDHLKKFIKSSWLENCSLVVSMTSTSILSLSLWESMDKLRISKSSKISHSLNISELRTLQMHARIIITLMPQFSH